MKLVRQPRGSNQCGQACVATYCEISLDEACMLARTKGGTNTKQLKRILNAMGVPHGDKRVLGFPPNHLSALLFWRSDNGCHWMLWHKRKFYDPVAGVFRRPPKHVENARVTSYLVIGEKKE